MEKTKMGSHDHSCLRSLSSSSSELTDLCSQVPLINCQESKQTSCFDYESKDTLQSLVQSCLCGRRDRYIKWQQNSFTSHVESIEAQKPVLPTQNSISVVENYTEKNFPQVTKHEAGVEVDGTSLINSYSTKVVVSEKEVKQKNKNKHRIKWTVDLDKKFIDSVNRLGGFKQATPSGILRLMNCEELTLFHVKSHLQKYRVTRHKHEVHQGNGTLLDSKTYDEQNKSAAMIKLKRADIVEALKLQMNVQQRLHEQLESQKKLQMKIEEQAKQLHDMLQFQRQLKRN